MFGSITFICPVSQPLKKGSYILKAHTSYTIGKSQASIILKKSKKDDYSIYTVLDAIIHLPEPGSKYRTQYSGPQRIEFKFKEFYYWVELTINKDEAIGDQAIYGVELIRE
ncbi:MAG: hypothetical protein D3925_03820 [Candidatus Electrothrix sp. AR5]|nr:hypothetical protein [Candidatus Electrothrix sp. AR5]